MSLTRPCTHLFYESWKIGCDLDSLILIRFRISFLFFVLFLVRFLVIWKGISRNLLLSPRIWRERESYPQAGKYLKCLKQNVMKEPTMPGDGVSYFSMIWTRNAKNRNKYCKASGPTFLLFHLCPGLGICLFESGRMKAKLNYDRFQKNVWQNWTQGRYESRTKRLNITRLLARSLCHFW